jgi:small GTP-binding protein
MDDGSDSRPLKVILVGSPSVGKTCLINAYFGQPFEADVAPTVAPAFCASNVTVASGTSVEVHVWDTAGQERFQSIGTLFYRDSDVAFICFDISTVSSISGWVERVRHEVPECIVFLVATKSDLFVENDRNELMDSVTPIMDEVKAKDVFLTSAKTGEAVKDLFESAAACIDEIRAPTAPATVLVSQPVEAKSEGCC